jgi:hypothetical protein
MPLVLIQSDARARQKPCLRCGYSLRKIVDARHCPECGLSIWVSLNQNDSLDWSRPEWLRQISMGAMVMAAGQLVGVLFGMMMLLPQNWKLAGWVLGVYLATLGAGMMLLGIPEKRYPDKLKGFRWFLVGAGGAKVLLALYVLTYSAMGRSALDRWEWFFWIVEFLLVIAAVATLLYLRKLAHRLGSHKLAKAMGWMLLIPLLKFVQVFPFCGLYLASQAIGLSSLLPWLYVPISLGILIYLAIGFGRAAKEAEVNWASAG